MSTANDIINRALREINVLEAGEIPSAQESQDSLETLNGMIDSWQAESLMIFTSSRVVLTPNPTIGVQAFTLGPGGFWDMPRPAKIDRYGIISLNNPSQPLELPMNDTGGNLTVDQWANISVKAVDSSLPLYCWDDEGYPLRTFYLWCIPNSDVQVVIYPWQLLNSFDDLVTDVTFPPAYYECVVYNLALRLTGQFGGNIPAILPGMAQNAMQRVKSINTPDLLMQFDPALTPGRGYYNWISDTFGPTVR